MENLSCLSQTNIPTEPSVSIIICTYNRAQSLRATLDGLAKARIPQGWAGEVIVVDNGSTDETEEVVKTAVLSSSVRYLKEPKRGLDNARNTGLAHARGDIILFTDDDVQVAKDWVERMVDSLISGKCDAVTGRITIPPGSMKPWMTYMHALGVSTAPRRIARPWNFRVRFRSPRRAVSSLYENGTVELRGANMGFWRHVLSSVAGFDPELDVGALGLCGETLFSQQLGEAGFAIAYAPDAHVVHHFDLRRLRRESLLEGYRKYGRSLAYVRYHWEHKNIKVPWLLYCLLWIKLHLRRALNPRPPPGAEGCPPWELSYIQQLEMLRQFRVERNRPRNYTKRGLKKLEHSKLVPRYSDSPTGRGRS
jgi:glycosyltransferase involved in cell wall biosynthesis